MAPNKAAPQRASEPVRYLGQRAEAAMSLFDQSVELHALGEHRYGAEVNAAWNGPAAPNGGVLAATMLRAVQAELGPAAPPPRTLDAHYLEAPQAGEVQISVESLRTGRRVAVGDARMHQGGRLVCHATVVLSAARAQPHTLTRDAPAATPPADTPLLADEALRNAPDVFAQLEIRPIGVPELFSGAERAELTAWVALRGDDAPLDPARLCALTDLMWPAVFGALNDWMVVPTLQLTVHLRNTAEMARGPVLARFRTRHVAEGHLEETGELWSADGVLLAESRQLALLMALPVADGLGPRRGG